MSDQPRTAQRISIGVVGDVQGAAAYWRNELDRLTKAPLTERQNEVVVGIDRFLGELSGELR